MDDIDPSLDPSLDAPLDQLSYAFDHVQTGLVLMDGSGRIRRANEAGARIVGRTQEELRGIMFPDLAHPEDLEAALEELERLLTHGHGGPIIVRIGTPDGQWVWIRAHATMLPSEKPLAFVVFEDVTAEQAMAAALRQAEADMRHHALHDELTGLPNRTLVLDHLELALHQARQGQESVAVIVCDLDRFKVVNDGLGHAAGDHVLCVVADRLTAHVRPGDTVGRFGGDEFVVICPGVDGLPDVVAMAERLSAAFAEPLEVEGTTLVASASLGISLGDHDGPGTAAGLLRDADAAMYRAKAHGRGRYELFDDEMRARASQRLQVEAELRRAVAEGELVLHYQPVVDLDGGHVAGVEALVRWQHPVRGLLGPDQFLAVADESGLLGEVGQWVLAEATAQTARWMTEPGWARRWTAVNLAAREVTDPGLVRRVDACISDSGVDPTLLRVELTEESLLEDTEQVTSVLDALRRRGLAVSVDDFGTGYSSLAYLKRLPLDALKLDRAFVGGLGADGSDDAVIAAAIIDMAHALRLRVVAEGVETEQQLEVLRAMGCDQAQGYLIARPMPPDELTAWIAERV